VSHPLCHIQVHSQGHVPDKAEETPEEQRLLVGATVTAVPFADPHTQFTGGGVPQLTETPQIVCVPEVNPRLAQVSVQDPLGMYGMVQVTSPSRDIDEIQ